MSEKKKPESMHMKKCERVGPVVFRPDNDTKECNIYKKMQSIVSFDSQRFIDTGERYRRLVAGEEPKESDDVISIMLPGQLEVTHYVKV